VTETDEVGELDAATDTLANSDALCVADDEPLTALVVALIDGDEVDDPVKEGVLLPLPAGVLLSDADNVTAIDEEAEALEELVEEAVGDPEDEKDTATLWVELAEAAGEKLAATVAVTDEVEEALPADVDGVAETEKVGELEAATDKLANSDALCVADDEPLPALAVALADDEPLTALAVVLVDGDGDDDSVKEDVLLPLPAGVPLSDADDSAVIDAEAEALEEPAEEAEGEPEDEKEANTL
jgi:hypothetical protein